MARYLGLDYGLRRIGVAISDESFLLAREVGILRNDHELFSNISKIIIENNVEKIILGLPLSLRTGHDTEQTVLTRDFAQKLAAHTKIKVELLDERFTSKIALSMPKTTKNKINKDSFAAQIILQSFLDRKK